jgi:hypothetical protein
MQDSLSCILFPGLASNVFTPSLVLSVLSPGIVISSGVERSLHALRLVEMTEGEWTMSLMTGWCH